MHPEAAHRGQAAARRATVPSARRARKRRDRVERWFLPPQRADDHSDGVRTVARWSWRPGAEAAHVVHATRTRHDRLPAPASGANWDTHGRPEDDLVKTWTRKLTIVGAAAAISLGAAACEIEDNGGLDDPGIDDPALDDPLLEE